MSTNTTTIKMGFDTIEIYLVWTNFFSDPKRYLERVFAYMIGSEVILVLRSHHNFLSVPVFHPVDLTKILPLQKCYRHTDKQTCRDLESKCGSATKREFPIFDTLRKNSSIKSVSFS